MDGIDAVMIASPDFHHTTHLEAAAKARKHIYVEKPLATEMDKLVKAYDAAKEAQAAGSVIQVGTQLRSLPGIAGARALVQAGTIGKITRIDETRNSERPTLIGRNFSVIGRSVPLMRGCSRGGMVTMSFARARFRSGVRISLI
jgi:predicted dehydrogenase